MHYVIGDIHNEAKKLNSILEQIHITQEDEVIVLGDLFDRGGTEPDPVGVFFMLSGLQGHCTWIRGNHDQWLADYIKKYYSLPERRRNKMNPYTYNSFDILRQRMTEVDLLDLADLIYKLPFQKEYCIDGKNYLFAHAMTSNPAIWQPIDYYMTGNWDIDAFFLEGIDGYISLCGHTPTSNVLWKNKATYLDEYMKSIWRNEKENVYLLDCGCGFASGKLACLCLETGKRFYSQNVLRNGI